MPGEKTLASVSLTLRHAVDKLGESAKADPLGAALLHDLRAAIFTADLFTDAAPTLDELLELTDEAARLNERMRQYVDGRRAARVAAMLPDSTRPPAITQADIRDALEGPGHGQESETLEQCPACRACTLCGDRRFVPVSTASAWRVRNMPRR